jgi:gamma-glutamyltranspeptidase
MKHGFAVRTALGDPGTPADPSPHASSIWAATKDLLSDAFVTQMRGVTSDTGVLDSKQYGGKWNPQGWVPPEEHGTSHLNVVDRWRNAVSITSTVGHSSSSRSCDRDGAGSCCAVCGAVWW